MSSFPYAIGPSGRWETQSRIAIAIACVASKIELGLKAITAKRKNDGDGEIASAGRQGRQKLHAHAMPCTTVLGEQGNLRSYTRLFAHG